MAYQSVHTIEHRVILRIVSVACRCHSVRSPKVMFDFATKCRVRYPKSSGSFAKRLLWRAYQRRLKFMTLPHVWMVVQMKTFSFSSWFLSALLVVFLANHLELLLSWYYVLMTSRCSLVYSVWPLCLKNLRNSPEHTKYAFLSIAAFDISIVLCV